MIDKENKIHKFFKKLEKIGFEVKHQFNQYEVCDKYGKCIGYFIISDENEKRLVLDYDFNKNEIFFVGEEKNQ